MTDTVDLSEFNQAQEVFELREALRRTQVALSRSKKRVDELVDATISSARDAVLSMGPIKITPPKAVKQSGKPEVALWDLGDFQGGKLTTSYNSQIMSDRVHLFVDHAAEITDIQRSHHPVTECVIIFGGDMVEGLFNFPCVDTETEALTRTGWKRLDELDGQEILIFDPTTSELRYELPETIFTSPYNGPMLHFTSRVIDHLVTPHHRMWTRTRRNNPWKIRRAYEIGKNPHWVRTSGTWTSGKWIVPPVEATKRTPGWDWSCDPDDLAAFLGWFVAEGTARYGEVFVSQSLRANPTKYASIKALLERLTVGLPRMRNDGGIPFSCNEKGFRISSTALAAWVKQFKPDGARSACLPDWMRNWPAAQLHVFLEAFIDGDGCRTGSGDRFGNKGAQIFTVSPCLLDDLTEIAIKLGYSTSRKTYPPGTWNIREGSGETLEKHVLTLSHQERTIKSPETVLYEGTIWCPRVSTGLWLSRRNGKPIITGNTQPFEIDSTIFAQYVQVSKLLVESVSRALTLYDKVTVVAEWGNHGRIGSKRAAVPRSDNTDRMCYELARQLLAGESRLTWHDCPEDIQRLQIGEYRAIVLHGDEIGRNGFASQNTIVNHVNRWRSGAYPWSFLDCYVHHYHTHYEQSLADGRGHLYGTGSTESDNRYASIGLASAGHPSQRLHFVDPRKGRVTAQYQIYLD